MSARLRETEFITEVNTQSLTAELNVARIALETAGISGSDTEYARCCRVALYALTLVRRYIGSVAISRWDHEDIAHRLAALDQMLSDISGGGLAHAEQVRLRSQTQVPKYEQRRSSTKWRI